MRGRGWRSLGLLLALSAWACDDDGSSFERMLEQPRYDAYEAGPFFPDGKVLQRPPEGTVAHDREPPGLPLATDAEPTPELIERGRSRYHIYCAVCHGAAGFGGSVVAVNMVGGPRPPPLRALGRVLPPEHIFRVAREGSGRMPSYADVLTVEDTWAVVAYVRTLHERPVTGRAEVLDSLRAAGSRP